MPIAYEVVNGLLAVVVREGRPAESDAFGNLANVQLCSREKLDQVLAHRVGERDEQVAADGEVLAQGSNLGIERTWIDQAAHVLFVR